MQSSLTAHTALVVQIYAQRQMWWYYLSPTGRDPMQPACSYPEGGCTCSDGYLSILRHLHWQDNPVEFMAALEDVEYYYDDNEEASAEPRRLEIVNGPLQLKDLD